MLALKYLLIVAGVLMLAAAFTITLYDLWKLLSERFRPRATPSFADDWPEGLPGSEAAPPAKEQVRWRTAAALALAACVPLLVAAGIVVIPAGMGGVRVSQMRGTLPGTLYSGAHFVAPLVDNVQVFDLRDKLFTAGATAAEAPAPSAQKSSRGAQNLDVQSKEGLNIGLSVQTDIQQKQVRIAELQAEADAAQKVKEAEGDAKSKVVEAKGEADAMQYTLPLKQKQIEQSKLEAEARKEATIENADAEATAKVIDSKAEVQRREMLAEAEAQRIRVTAAADNERMMSEAKLLNQSPLLINKIIAERLSDKIQMVMVPSDGKFFFANDVFRGLDASPELKQQIQQQMEGDETPATGAPPIQGDSAHH